MDIDVPEPVFATSDTVQEILRTLHGISFNEKSCGDRLGRSVFLDSARSPIPRPYLKDTSDSLDVAIALFLLSEKIPLQKAQELFTMAELNTLAATLLIRIDEAAVYSDLNLFPCANTYIATDSCPLWLKWIKKNLPWPREPRDSGKTPVMWLLPESYVLAGVVDRTTRLSAALDLGTGSGIHALLAARHSELAVGVDINPRAVAFSCFNKAFNHLGNVDFIVGDLYAPVAGRRFDLIVANPPYNPTPQGAPGSNYWSGGSSGEAILSRIVGGIGEHLEEDGVCHIITLLCHGKSGPTYEEKLDSWLVGGIGRYDVMAQVIPADYYFDSPGRESLRENFARFEYGVISIRRNRKGAGFYYHGAPRLSPPFFNENGRFRAPVNHESFDLCHAEMASSGLAH